MQRFRSNGKLPLLPFRVGWRRPRRLQEPKAAPSQIRLKWRDCWIPCGRPQGHRSNIRPVTCPVVYTSTIISSLRTCSKVVGSFGSVNISIWGRYWKYHHFCFDFLQFAEHCWCENLRSRFVEVLVWSTRLRISVECVLHRTGEPDNTNIVLPHPWLPILH